MSVEFVKTLAVDFERETISLSAASSNVFPRTYAPWNPVSDERPFQQCLESLAWGILSGSLQFLPSCQSKAHEAALKTADKLGTGDDLRYLSKEYREFADGWAREFIRCLRDDPRDKSTYVPTRFGRPIDLSIRRDARRRLIVGRYRYDGWDHPIGWVKAWYARHELDGIDLVPADRDPVGQG